MANLLPSCQPIHFLNLPVEIRSKIYYHAFLHPDPIRGCPPHKIHVLEPKTAHATRWSGHPWWGTEPMTRLLRINHQIHDEAEKVLYTRFCIGFPLHVTTQIVRKLLIPMSDQARSSIRSVGVCIALLTKPFFPLGSVTLNRALGSVSKENVWRDAFALIVELLPRLQSVDMSIIITGGDVEGELRRRTVDSAIRIASPLKGVKHLTIRTHKSTERQQVLVDDIKERVQAGIWE
ncbi:hypothetical protein MMC06_005729 [Schaereria dolodes]|nr:hypothetical protein [Schaereria dolodes]